jgi:hypothetical protein
LWNQWVTYPVKAREAAWHKELDERRASSCMVCMNACLIWVYQVEHPAKKRRVPEIVPSERMGRNLVELDASPARNGNIFESRIHMEVDNIGGGGFDGDYGGMGMSLQHAIASNIMLSSQPFCRIEAFGELAPVQLDLQSGGRRSSDVSNMLSMLYNEAYTPRTGTRSTSPPFLTPPVSPRK